MFRIIRRDQKTSSSFLDSSHVWNDGKLEMSIIYSRNSLYELSPHVITAWQLFGRSCKLISWLSCRTLAGLLILGRSHWQVHGFALGTLWESCSISWCWTRCRAEQALIWKGLKLRNSIPWLACNFFAIINYQYQLYLQNDLKLCLLVQLTKPCEFVLDIRVSLPNETAVQVRWLLPIRFPQFPLHF